MSCTLKVNFSCSAIQTRIKQTPTANIDEDDNEEIVGFKPRWRLKPPHCSDPYRSQGSLHPWHWQLSPISSSHTVLHTPSSVTLSQIVLKHISMPSGSSHFCLTQTVSLCAPLGGQRGSRNDDNYHYAEADIRGRRVGRKATEGRSSGQRLVMDEMFGTFLCTGTVIALPGKIQQNPSLKTVNTPVKVHGRTPEVARIVFKWLRIQIMQVNSGKTQF